MAGKSAEDTHKIADEQSVFLFGKEAGKSQSTECQRIIQKYLNGMYHVGACDKL